MNSTLREKIDTSIVGKLVNAKVNFGLGAPIKGKKILKFTNELAEELHKQVRSFREDGLMLMALMKSGLLI